ncbi:hypothetical protein OG711_28775 [Streptomyces uncialis]|uniref:hypothetical protein n=1 Tax=Streptomyces uncialis TaxID=1048205 RepID=UPI002E34DC97|nr:hypothetical protein [Streptomyces uncialis]
MTNPSPDPTPPGPVPRPSGPDAPPAERRTPPDPAPAGGPDGARGPTPAPGPPPPETPPTQPSPVAPAPGRWARGRARWATLGTAERTAIAVPLLTALVAGVFGLGSAALPVVFAKGDKKEGGSAEGGSSGKPADRGKDSGPSLTPPFLSPSPEDARLAIVDISVGDRGNPAELDVKVRNKGRAVSYVKRAEIRVHRARTLPFCPLPYAVPVSYTYQVELPATDTDLAYSKPLDLSQAVEPDKVDRFVVELGTKGLGKYTPGGALYYLTVRLDYNEGTAGRVESEPLLVYVAYPVEVAGLTEPGISEPRFRACWKKRIAAVRAFKDLDATRPDHVSGLEKTTDQAAEAINTWERANTPSPE